MSGRKIPGWLVCIVVAYAVLVACSTWLVLKQARFEARAS